MSSICCWVINKVFYHNHPLKHIYKVLLIFFFINYFGFHYYHNKVFFVIKTMSANIHSTFQCNLQVWLTCTWISAMIICLIVLIKLIRKPKVIELNRNPKWKSQKETLKWEFLHRKLYVKNIMNMHMEKFYNQKNMPLSNWCCIYANNMFYFRINAFLL